MSLTEFKAWFEGYTEGMDGPPNVEQWDRIKAKLATVTELNFPVIQQPISVPWNFDWTQVTVSETRYAS